MAPLAQLSDALATIPRLRLGRFPTPVEKLDLSAVGSSGVRAWVKREDRSGNPLGGNKVRKLEYLLADARARGAGRVVAIGGIGSNYCLATAFYAPDASLDVELVLVPHEVTPSTRRTLRAICSLGPRITVVRGTTPAAAVAAARLAWLRATGRRPYGMLPGGSTVTGTLGWVAAGIELAEQVRAGELAEPHAVFCAYSSGGTAAGLAVGMQTGGLRCRVVAVQVYPAPLTSGVALRLLARRTVARVSQLAGRKVMFDPALLEVRGGYLGGGYAVPTEAGAAAKEVAADLGYELEPTYTAKAFAAFLDHAGSPASRGRDLLFLLSYDGGIPEELTHPPEELIPERLRDFI